MWSYGQCLDNIKGIVGELNTMFSMLIELLTNDSLLSSAATSLPNLVAAIKAMALTLCVMFFLIDFFTKTLNLQWVTWENVLMLFIKLVFAKVCVDNSELLTTMLYKGFNGFVNAISGTITQYRFIDTSDWKVVCQYFVSGSQASQIRGFKIVNPHFHILWTLRLGLLIILLILCKIKIFHCYFRKPSKTNVR